MSRTIERSSLNSYIKDLNSSIKKTERFFLEIYKPSEDPDGKFSEFCQKIIMLDNKNLDARKKFAEYIKSEEFHNDIYKEVGSFLGFKKEDILKKNIRNKILKAVITDTFQSFFEDDDYEESKGESKYLPFEKIFHSKFNIFPSEKKGVFFNHYIKNNRLFVHDAVVDASKLRPVMKILSQSELKKLTKAQLFQLAENENINLKGSSSKEEMINSIYSQESLAEISFNTKKHIGLYKSSGKSLYKLESNVINLFSHKTKMKDMGKHSVKKLTVERKAIGKNCFKIRGLHRDLSSKYSVELESISRPVTSNDLILDAEWFKVTRSHGKPNFTSFGYLRGINLNRTYKTQLDNKGDWIYKYKNSKKNREKLHKFLSSRSFKLSDLEGYRFSFTSGFFVTGDFILNSFDGFSRVSFPMGSSETFGIITNLKRVDEVINNILVKKLNSIEKDFIDGCKEDMRKIFEFMKEYNKPVDLNDSINFVKGQLGAITTKFSNDAKSVRHDTNSSAFFKMFTEDDLYILKTPTYADTRKLDYFTLLENGPILHRVWETIISKNDNTPEELRHLSMGSKFKKRQQEERQEDIFARNHTLKYILDEIENTLKKSKVSYLEDLDNWLNDEQLHFSQQYFKNFEEHPDASTREHIRVLQKYKKMSLEKVKTTFLNKHKIFITDKRERYVDKIIEESPEKKIKKLNEKFLKKIKSIPEKDLDADFVSKIKEKLGFPNKNSFLMRFTTDSYSDNGKELKELEKKFTDASKVIEKRPKNSEFQTRKEFETTIMRMTLDMETDQKEVIEYEKEMNPILDARDVIKSLIPKMRKWLAYEETNYLKAVSGTGNTQWSYRLDVDRMWFYFPDYKKSSIKNLFQLKGLHPKTWNKGLIDTITQMMNLIRMDVSYGIDFDIELNKRKSWFDKCLAYDLAWSRATFSSAFSSDDDPFDKLVRKTSPLQRAEMRKMLDELNNEHFENDAGPVLYKKILGKIQKYAKMQAKISLHKSFYGAGDSMFRVILFMDGYNPYGSSRAKTRREYEEMQAEFQVKENIESSIKKDINTLIDLYEDVLDQMINRFSDSSLPSKKPTLNSIISIWEGVNHLKAIRKYIDLICKYDLFDLAKIDSNNTQINNKYISKVDANFLLRKTNKNATIYNLEDLRQNMKNNEMPNHLNNNKYRELKRKIDNSPILSIEKINGVDCIERTKFIEWFHKRSSYRALDYFKFINNETEEIGMSSLLADTS